VSGQFLPRFPVLQAAEGEADGQVQVLRPGNRVIGAVARVDVQLLRVIAAEGAIDQEADTANGLVLAPALATGR
jgi:hypothetical protein